MSLTLTNDLTEMVVANHLDLARLEILEQVIQVCRKLLSIVGSNSRMGQKKRNSLAVRAHN